MAGFLAKEFRKRMKKMKDPRMSNEGTMDIGYPTGFTNLDFRNASVVMGKKNGKPHKNYILGLLDGSMNMIVGKSGSGKTTLALQIAGNIAREFGEDSLIYYDDIEGGSTSSRRKFLLKLTDEELADKCIYRNCGITVENIYMRIKEIYDLKMENKEALMYPTGMFDATGEEIIAMKPTIYIVDSVATMMPEKYAEEDEISGQMAATATAKANKALANRLLQLIKPANIIMIFINHINDEVSLMPKKPMINFLKMGETLPGGKGIHYLQNNIIRIDEGNKKAVDKFDITGNVSMVSFIKSRTNKSGQGVPLIFNQSTGFDNELSILQLLNENKRINGAGAFLYIDDAKDKKFSNKKFKEKLFTDEEFNNIVSKAALECLNEMVSYETKIEESDEDVAIQTQRSMALSGKITSALMD